MNSRAKYLNTIMIRIRDSKFTESKGLVKKSSE